MPVARTDHPRQMFDFLLDESRCDVSDIASLNHARAPDSGSGKRKIDVFARPSLCELS
jgi:hypothetical protein